MKLFNEFSSQTKADWLAKVEKDLKGKPIKGLQKQYEDHTFLPFFHQEDLKDKPEPLLDSRTDNTWQIGEFIIVKGQDYKAANRQALSALMRGANALCFEINKTPSIDEMRVLIADIQHEWISTSFVCQEEKQGLLVENFVEILKEKGQNPAQVNSSFQSRLSPLQNIEEFKKANAILPKGVFLIADVKGEYATLAAEIADALHQANGFLNQLADAALKPADYVQNITFSLTLNDDYFPMIAKIRALKNLWQQVLNTWKIKENVNINIEVHLTEQYQSEDENYNKIKATTQAMSAVIGGATALFIHPSDQFKTAGGNAFSQRIALNINHLMQQESYLYRVADPAAGSYYIESLTDKIGEQAWNIFREKN